MAGVAAVEALFWVDPWLWWLWLHAIFDRMEDCCAYTESDARQSA
jgi:hypothetical protein